jgi:hypothetical protein
MRASRSPNRRKRLRATKSQIASRIISGMDWKIHVLCRVRNESIGYIALIDRTKPDNSVRINPAARHSETKYGFVILTGDVILEDFFVRMKLLLRHEHLSSTAVNSSMATKILTRHASKTKLRGPLTWLLFDRGLAKRVPSESV